MNIETPVRRRVVLDTDTYNEVDDQFALSHLLLSPDRVQLEAVYAAPFHNGRSDGPADGMEKSYQEIMRLLDLIQPETLPPVYHGSDRWMTGPEDFVESDASRNLIARARASEDLLYVVVIGAPTNVSSALVQAPDIKDKICIVWLGGHAAYWPDTGEFNLKQDLHASRILLQPGLNSIRVPCVPVASHLAVTVPELEAFLEPHSRLGAYLTDIVRHYEKNAVGWSKVIWDIGATAYVLNPAWLQVETQRYHALKDDRTWAAPDHSESVQVVSWLHRDAIFSDFYERASRLP